MNKVVFKLRDYQSDIAQKACQRLRQLGLVYIAAQVRCGKTHMSLEAARLFGAKKVLFLTKKKVLSTDKRVGSVEFDYNEGKYPFEIVIINVESIHSIKDNDFDLLVADESHQYGQFPKPANRTIEVKKRFGHLPIIFLTGTPTPESGSQIYHQLFLSNRSPFREFTNFYKWAHQYVKIYQRNMGYATVNVYDRAKQELIDPILAPYLLTFSQQEAGFQSEVKEHFLEVEMKPIIYQLIEQLKRDFCIIGKEKTVTADSAVKLLSKCHQAAGGTLKFDDGTAMILDKTKGEFIKNHFRGKKIGIFYKFKCEWDLLKEVFGESLCNNLDEFVSTDKNIALQIQSGREGISLKEADCLVYYSVDFSSVSYQQSKARSQTRDRLETEVYWIFGAGTLDADIYKKVKAKGKYTAQYFLKSNGIKFPKQEN
ncbi:MAG TPA: hypothetical protein PKY12_09860 [Catalimonadaceae bacterium]|nr:hypothetical protein [Catalimonadaceae bacterium]